MIKWLQQKADKALEDSKAWVYVGRVSVETGMLFLSDPCYISISFCEGWADFCTKMNCTAREMVSSNGKISAVCVKPQEGDGLYPVYVKYGMGGRVRSLLVDLGEQKNERKDEEGWAAPGC